ncbi:MAG TPA: anti-sigma factor [Xanthobacteraceae bacterium]|nr:anti-sigma factor [Xanthobacteraceae bacterium]
MSPGEPISDADLQAYVDDQLGVERRIDVEAYLSRHAEAATRVMADLRIRDELRLALADVPRRAAPLTVGAARRLEQGLARDRLFGRLQRAASIALLIGAGWFAHAQFGPLGVSQVSAAAPPPAYVSDAVMAHRTTLVRSAMRSQPGAPDYDPAEIRAATAIVMPVLPEGWTVTDVQIFPSTFGPSVELVVRTGDFGTATLFAVRPGAFDVVPATLAHKDELTAAYWQMGEVAYALVAGGGSPTPDRATLDQTMLDQAGTRLARSLY